MHKIFSVSVNQLFSVSQMCEKYLAKGKDVHWDFVDLENSYAIFDSDAMTNVLRLYGAGGSLMKAVYRYQTL